MGAGADLVVAQPTQAGGDLASRTLLLFVFS